MKLSITLCTAGLVIAMLCALPTTAQVYYQKRKTIPLKWSLKTNPINWSKDRYDLGMETYFHPLRISMDLHAQLFSPKTTRWPGLTVARRETAYFGGLRFYPFGLRPDFLRPKGYGCAPVQRQSPIFLTAGLHYQQVDFSVTKEETVLTRSATLDARVGAGLRWAADFIYVEAALGYNHRLRAVRSGDPAILAAYRYVPLYWSTSIGYNF